MLQTFKNAWKIPDLRKKMLFTLIIVLLYRIGAQLYVPFVDVDAISDYTKTTQLTSGIFGMMSLFSGGAFEQATLFALSVSPYITASIVVQLLTIAIPAWENLSKNGGEEGKKKLTKYTRIITVFLALITAYGYVKLLDSNSLLKISSSNKNFTYYFGMIVMVACFCAGAAVIMWLAERINDHGIGNGISIILFANIISRGGTMLTDLWNLVFTKDETLHWTWRTGGSLVGGIIGVVVYVAAFIALVGVIVWFTNSERRIPIQYAKRVVGRKMYGGQSSNLPLKMNMAGVMPIIFSSSIVSIIPTIAGFWPNSGFNTFVNDWLGTGTPIYIIAYNLLIFAFSYFYIMISFNPVEVANNIRSNGGAIPGIRPGKPTSDYIKKILNRITTLGAVFLVLVAGVPMILGAVLPDSYTRLTTFGGSSLLIVVGVALETAQAIEAQMSMRNYKGFLDS